MPSSGQRDKRHVTVGLIGYVRSYGMFIVSISINQVFAVTWNGALKLHVNCDIVFAQYLKNRTFLVHHIVGYCCGSR